MFTVLKDSTPKLPFVLYDIYGQELPTGSVSAAKLSKSGASFAAVTRTIATSETDTADRTIQLQATDTDTVGVHVLKLTGTDLMTVRIAYSVVEMSGGGGTVVVESGETGVQRNLRILLPGGIPVENAQVWVTSDQAGQNVTRGVKLTNSAGMVSWLFDLNVDYYLWAQKDGIEDLPMGQLIRWVSTDE